jgi:ketosteroid isomerase-like protein
MSLTAATVVVTLGCMTTGLDADIRRVVDAQASAVGRGDVDAMVADVADDIVSFDVVNPLRRLGGGSVRERAAAWVASFDGPITWDNRDVVITAAGDVAFASMLSRVSGTLKNGTRIDMFFRKTLGLRRRDGRWVITHDHASVPFDPDTGQASLALQP